MGLDGLSIAARVLDFDRPVAYAVARRPESWENATELTQPLIADLSYV